MLREILGEKEDWTVRKREKRENWDPLPWFSSYLPLDFLDAGQDKDPTSGHHDWRAPAETYRRQ